MYKNDLNAIRRARNSAGVTQEKLAEMSGYSVESIKAWESGTRNADIDKLDMLALCLSTPWLPSIYMRERSINGSLSNVIPPAEPDMPLSQAVLQLIHSVYAFIDKHPDRRLAAIAEDNVITTDERDEFDAITADLQKIVQAAHNLRYAKRGDETI